MAALSLVQALSDLKVGQCGFIQHIQDAELRILFYELGLMPNTRVSVCWQIPWLSLICIEAANERLALRTQEAQAVWVQCETTHQQAP